MDCLRAGSDGMVSVGYRHTNFNLYTQIYDRQKPPSAFTHFRLSETLTDLPGNLGSHRT